MAQVRCRRCGAKDTVRARDYATAAEHGVPLICSRCGEPLPPMPSQLASLAKGAVAGAGGGALAGAVMGRLPGIFVGIGVGALVAALLVWKR
jgi:ribosomal protein L40E